MPAALKRKIPVPRSPSGPVPVGARFDNYDGEFDLCLLFGKLRNGRVRYLAKKEAEEAEVE
jgi:hypothetical protein